MSKHPTRAQQGLVEAAKAICANGKWAVVFFGRKSIAVTSVRDSDDQPDLITCETIGGEVIVIAIVAIKAVLERKPFQKQL